MRTSLYVLISGVVSLAFAASVRGQSPDTLDWRRYFPLKVGNEWQFVTWDGAAPFVYTRNRIIGDTLINGMTYHIRLVEGGFDPDDLTASVRRTYERHIDDGAYIAEARIRPRDSTFTDSWDGTVCAADAPFDSFGDCPELQAGNYVSGGYGGEVQIGQDVVEVAAIKEFDTFGGFFSMAADIGNVFGAGELGLTWTLEYASVGGRTYGEPVVATAIERVAEIPGQLSVSVYPMPAMGSVWVELTDPSVSIVSIRIIDVLGRTMLRREVDGRAGKHRLRVDLNELASGYYIVAVVADRGELFMSPIIAVH